MAVELASSFGTSRKHESQTQPRRRPHRLVPFTSPGRIGRFGVHPQQVLSARGARQER